MIFDISGTKQTIRIIEVSVRRGSTVIYKRISLYHKLSVDLSWP